MIGRLAVPPLVVFALAWAAELVTRVGAGNPFRSIVVIGFLLLGPGLAVVPLLRIPAWPRLTLAIGLSLAVDILVSTGMTYAGIWSPDGILAMLVLISLIGAVAQLIAIPIRPARVLGDEP